MQEGGVHAGDHSDVDDALDHVQRRKGGVEPSECGVHQLWVALVRVCTSSTISPSCRRRPDKDGRTTVARPPRRSTRRPVAVMIASRSAWEGGWTRTRRPRRRTEIRGASSCNRSTDHQPHRLADARRRRAERVSPQPSATACCRQIPPSRVTSPVDHTPLASPATEPSEASHPHCRSEHAVADPFANKP